MRTAGEWQGQEGQGTGKNSIGSALEDDSDTGRSGGNAPEVTGNGDEEDPEPPTLPVPQEVRDLLAHQQGTSQTKHHID